MLEESHCEILRELCRLCIENRSLTSDRITYSFLSKENKKSSLKSSSVKDAIRKMEANRIIILRDSHFDLGRKGRMFEVSKTAMLCMLFNDNSLKRSLSRKGHSLSDLKNIYENM